VFPLYPLFSIALLLLIGTAGETNSEYLCVARPLVQRNNQEYPYIPPCAVRACADWVVDVAGRTRQGYISQMPMPVHNHMAHVNYNAPVKGAQDRGIFPHSYAHLHIGPCGARQAPDSDVFYVAAIEVLHHQYLR